MKILQGIEGLRNVPRGSVLSIGNFDGLHRGHQLILQTCRRRSESLGRPWVIATFEPHPLTVLRPASAAPRLTPAPMKEELIAAMGADAYVILPPSQEVLNLSAEDFWRMLRDEVQPALLVEGPDFTFGKDRRGNTEKLSQWAAADHVALELIEPLKVALLDLSLVAPSSSMIRRLLLLGRARDAAICLGRPYALRGTVVKGFGRGKGIGFPTANLQCNDQLIPADAVYAGRCRVGAATYTAAVSIGEMPTFSPPVRQVEAYLLDYDGDLYGQTVDLELLDWLRDQRKFSGVAALKAQIDQDVVQTRRRASLDPTTPIAVAEPARA